MVQQHFINVTTNPIFSHPFDRKKGKKKYIQTVK